MTKRWKQPVRWILACIILFCAVALWMIEREKGHATSAALGLVVAIMESYLMGMMICDLRSKGK